MCVYMSVYVYSCHLHDMTARNHTHKTGRSHSQHIGQLLSLLLPHFLHTPRNSKEFVCFGLHANEFLTHDYLYMYIKNRIYICTYIFTYTL